jgi:hypothetical protein
MIQREKKATSKKAVEKTRDLAQAMAALQERDDMSQEEKEEAVAVMAAAVAGATAAHEESTARTEEREDKDHKRMIIGVDLS